MPPRYIDSEERAERADEQQRQQVAAVLAGLIEPPAIQLPIVYPADRAAARVLATAAVQGMVPRDPRPNLGQYFPGHLGLPPPDTYEDVQRGREAEITQPALSPPDESAFQRMLWKEREALDAMKKLKRGNRLGHKHTASGGVRKHHRRG